jgi:hypothetical protein
MKEQQTIFRESTAKTPQVDFNSLTGELIIAGRSIPENATGLYEPLINWVNEYIKDSRPVTNLRLNLEYFNTASSIWIAKIIRSLGKIENPENVLFLHLYFPIEEFDNMEVEDLKDALIPIVDIINSSTISVGVKIYGTDDDGGIIKESMVLL